MRLKILGWFQWVPDRTMLQIQYWIKFGRKLDLKNPKRFTEKMQWYKLYYRDKTMIQCVDKYDVREYLKRRGFGRILVDNYGVYSSFEEIDFKQLPKKFIIKDTLGAGGNSVYICDDKSKIDYTELKDRIDNWLGAKQVKNGGREWPYYSGKQNRIIIEELLESDSKHGLVDYKFLCFNGKVEMFYVMCDRIVGKEVKLGIYNRNVERLNVRELTELEIDFPFEFPENICEMINIAEELASCFPQVRVDLYNVDGRVTFGELTFFDESGYMIFDPDSFDTELGNKFVLPSPRRDRI